MAIVSLLTSPVNQDFTDRIGADGYSVDAHKAVALARKLVVLTPSERKEQGNGLDS